MRYDIAVSPKNANAGPVTRGEPDPNDPSKTVQVDVPLEQSAAELGAVIGLTGEQVQQIIADSLAENAESDFAYVAKLVDTDTYERVKDLGIPWVVPWEHPSRYYPNGAVGGNLIGFVDPDGNAVAGLEYSEDECLAGQDGAYSYLHSLEDWVQIPGTEVVHEQAHDGGTLKLTIDSDLQWMVQRIAEAQVQAVGADWATVTVMEAKTGRLLAVADVPTVDPNAPSATDSANRGSRAFTAPFEPGSTFKALTAASVIDAGKADPVSQIVAPYRYLPPNGANINDSGFHGDERLTLTGVLIESSNTGMVFGTIVGVILYVIWICLLTVAASNGVNVTDGLDGLAGGASILAIGSFVIIGFWQFNQSCFSENLNPSDAYRCYEVRDPLDIAIVATAIVGGLIGFLWWNTNPAHIYMGDTGSLALGGALAALAIVSHTELLLLLIGGLFVIETGSVIVQRAYFKLSGGKRVFLMAAAAASVGHRDGTDRMVALVDAALGGGAGDSAGSA